MSILVSIVSHPHSSGRASVPGVFGFQALKPAIAIHSQFLEMLVSRLSSADHALCANSLQLINSLMRDSITNQSEAEWPKFIKQLQDLSVIRAVYVLMQGSALQDLAHPLLEFQSLTKLLLRKWREVPVELEKTEHRRGLKSIHLASNPEKPEKVSAPVDEKNGDSARQPSKKHNPRKWRRLGFQTESPQLEFKAMGFLGMMDLTDYVRKHQDEFQKLLLEQTARPVEQRCPISRASLAVTAILYEHFEVDKSDIDDPKSYLILESGSNFDKLFKPLLLHWPRLHVAGLRSFFRLWKSTSAEHEDFSKIVDLVRILIESVVGGAIRTKDIQDIEEEMVDFECQRLRELQMELLELTYEDAWGQHLQQVREELHHEALQFVKEQRVRCLLQGAWFPLTETGPKGGESNGLPRSTKYDAKRTGETPYRYVQLSHNRRHLHYADFESADEQSTPDLESLPQKSKHSILLPPSSFSSKHTNQPLGKQLVDLGMVSSVVSNVSASPDNSSGSTIKTLPHPSTSSTKITIHGYAQPPNSNPFMSPQASFSQDPQRTIGGKAEPQNEAKPGGDEEIILLTLYPQSHSVASEWLDGLLMILNQQPITAETNKLINMVSNYGLKIRLLNVRFDDTAFIGECPEVPSREGLDEDYYYDIFGGA